MMPRLLAALALASLLLPGAACGLTVTDQTGRRVILPGPPARIISLVPSVTETVFTIGAQDRLVGVTDFCDYPAEARRKPRVGSMISPSLEGIVALKPDLVVATTAGNRHETFDQLVRLKIPIYLVNPVSVSDVLDLIGRLGRLTDRPEPAGRLVVALRERIQAVVARVAGRPRPRVLYVLWPDPLIVPARGALVSELLGLAGGDSVTADGGPGYPRYSMEAALARNPEVILVARHDPTGSPLARSTWERFTQVPAVSAGRLHTVDGDLMHRYGPRVVDGLEVLARLIHPGAFEKAARR
ncbi:MAG TPA: cobalamin-binding protein [Candidatus Limnocylindria bacterium]|nr:cobalamin-binding protein [Candidatus Limnocylindria bacterium]